MLFSLINSIVQLHKAVLALIYNRAVKVAVKILEIYSVLFAGTVIVIGKNRCTVLLVNFVSLYAYIKITPDADNLQSHSLCILKYVINAFLRLEGEIIAICARIIIRVAVTFKTCSVCIHKALRHLYISSSSGRHRQRQRACKHYNRHGSSCNFLCQ